MAVRRWVTACSTGGASTRNAHRERPPTQRIARRETVFEAGDFAHGENWGENWDGFNSGH